MLPLMHFVDGSCSTEPETSFYLWTNRSILVSLLYEQSSSASRSMVLLHIFFPLFARQQLAGLYMNSISSCYDNFKKLFHICSVFIQLERRGRMSNRIWKIFKASWIFFLSKVESQKESFLEWTQKYFLCTR
jgi:hypothetical protein